MMKSLKKRISQISVAAMALAMLCASIPSSASYVKDGKSARAYGRTKSSITVSELTAYDSAGNKQDIGAGKSQADVAAEILPGVEEGRSGARKNGFFETEQDASSGIVKTVFDVASNPVDLSTDVVIILDQSASMNNYGKDNYDSVACLNDDHYYRIPTGTFGATEDIYFKVSDFGTSGCWRYLDADWWNALCTAYNLTCPDISTPTALKELFQNVWAPQENHYRLVDGHYVNIPAMERPATQPGGWSYPADNEYGCVDRMMIEKQAARELAERVLSNSANRVAVATFAKVVNDSVDFTTDLAAANAVIDTYEGHGWTNYDAAFQKAYEFINNRTDVSRKVNVVFITDGKPNCSGVSGDNITDIPAAESAARIAAQQLKNAGATVYCAGINSGAGDLLSQFASSNNLFKDCVTVDEFNDFAAGIMKRISGYPEIEIYDEIGTDFSIICDAKHPFTILDKVYTEFSAIPVTTVTFDADRRSFTWHGRNISADSVRISFYTKLDSTKICGAVGSEVYDTNGEAHMGYKYTYVAGGTVKSEDTFTEIALPSPKVKVDTNLITAALTSDKMTDNNPNVDGVYVEKGEEIAYNIEIKNDGPLTLDDIDIRDFVPSGTEYVSGGTPSSENSYADFTIGSIAPNGTANVQFKVRVTADSATISNGADFALKEYAGSFTAAGAPDCDTNTLRNPMKPTTTTTTTTTTSTTTTAATTNVTDAVTTTIADTTATDATTTTATSATTATDAATTTAPTSTTAASVITSVPTNTAATSAADNSTAATSDSSAETTTADANDNPNMGYEVGGMQLIMVLLSMASFAAVILFSKKAKRQ